MLKRLILEAGFGSQLESGIAIICNQINKRANKNFIVVPVFNAYQNAYGTFLGINLFSGNECLRFNVHSGTNINSIVSVDYWRGDIINDIPGLTFDFEGFNILQVLDDIIKYITMFKNEESDKIKVKKGSKSIPILSPEAQDSDLEEDFEYDKSSGAIYQQLSDFIHILSSTSSNGLLVTGEPGSGKTSNVINALNKRGVAYKYAKASITILGDLYKVLFKNNGNTIVLDEADILLRRGSIFKPFLMAALEMGDNRVLSYPTRRDKDILSGLYPQSFEFTVKLVFISNLSLEKIDSALVSRSLTVDISLTKKQILEEIQRKMGRFYPKIPLEIKMKVYKFLQSIRSKIKRLDFRKYEQILTIRLGIKSNAWKQYALNILR
jgi:hypothetical protein